MDTLRKQFTSIWAVALIIAFLIGIYLTVLYPWINQWGLTAAQANQALPGVDTEPGTVITSSRGITIHALGQ